MLRSFASVLPAVPLRQDETASRLWSVVYLLAAPLLVITTAVLQNHANDLSAAACSCTAELVSEIVAGLALLFRFRFPVASALVASACLLFNAPFLFFANDLIALFALSALAEVKNDSWAIRLTIGVVIISYVSPWQIGFYSVAPYSRILIALCVPAWGLAYGMVVRQRRRDIDQEKAIELAKARIEERVLIASDMERQRRFTADASHDLRAPITAMRTQLDEAMLYPADTDWTQTSDRLSHSLDRLSAIIEDLLVLARLDSGLAVDTEPVALDELVRTEAARPGLKHPVELDLTPVTVEGSRLQLSRAFGNLLDNAQRHADRCVRARVHLDGDHAVLEVYNDGDSIPAEQRQEVFRRFTRLENSRRKDSGGTGLGLAIVREIATAHAGTAIIADSSEGTRIVLRLPALTSTVR